MCALGRVCYVCACTFVAYLGDRREVFRHLLATVVELVLDGRVRFEAGRRGATSLAHGVEHDHGGVGLVVFAAGVGRHGVTLDLESLQVCLEALDLLVLGERLLDEDGLALLTFVFQLRGSTSRSYSFGCLVQALGLLLLDGQLAVELALGLVEGDLLLVECDGEALVALVHLLELVPRE